MFAALLKRADQAKAGRVARSKPGFKGKSSSDIALVATSFLSSVG